MQESSGERLDQITEQPTSDPQARRRSNQGRRRVARGATSTRERRRERTSTGAASTTSITSGPGSEDGREGIQASAEPDEGGHVSLRPPAF